MTFLSHSTENEILNTLRFQSHHRVLGKGLMEIRNHAKHDALKMVKAKVEDHIWFLSWESVAARIVGQIE